MLTLGASTTSQPVLRQHATLNPRPGGVTHTLFEGSAFFDPETCCRSSTRCCDWSTSTSARSARRPRPVASRVPSFYQAQVAFEQGGLAALIAHKPGPHGGHKLTAAVLQFVIDPCSFW